MPTIHLSKSTASIEARRVTRPQAAYLWIAAAFLVSRIFYYVAGVRFQTDLIQSNFQFIDVELMKHRLFESLFYYHMQPPLNNLIVGLIVKVFPNDYGSALHVLFMAAGLMSAMLLYRLLRRLRAPNWLACVLTILFITSPGCVLFENFPMYEYLIMTLLLAECVVLCRLLERPRFWLAFLFFSLLAATALLRATFHLYYLIAVAAVLAWYLKGHSKTIAAAAAIPLLLVTGLYAKNLVVFGFFGSSSWLGNNLPTVTTHNLTHEECQSLVRSGKLDAFGCVEGSSPPSTYHGWVPALQNTGIPVLDEEQKSVGGPNFNNQIYLKTGPMFTRTARQVLEYYPMAYVRSVLIAWFCYFRPPSDFFQFHSNLAPIHALDRAYNLIFFGQLREASGKELRAQQAGGRSFALVLYTGIILIVCIPLILTGATIVCIRERSFVVGFILVQIVMVAVISNFLSSYENNRYRFPTDPLYMALAGMLIALLLRRGRPPAES